MLSFFKMNWSIQMSLLNRLLTWWNGQTLNTKIWTSRHGVRVGNDQHGNVFYQTKDGLRRWVIYKGIAEATSYDTSWHGWLHHTDDVPPAASPVIHPVAGFDEPSNMTGTVFAHRPKGSLHLATPQTKPDYDAWVP